MSVSEINLYRRQAEKLREYPNGGVKLASVTLVDALDEIERLRGQVAELLPWVIDGIGADWSTAKSEAMLARIRAGEFGEVAQ
jgi:hypothetical protein